MVTVKYYGPWKQKIGTDEELIEAVNIKALLKTIKGKYGKEVFRAIKSSMITINGENAGFKGGYNAVLVSGDLVRFFPVCGGG